MGAAEVKHIFKRENLVFFGEQLTAQESNSEVRKKRGPKRENRWWTGGHSTPTHLHKPNLVRRDNRGEMPEEGAK